MSEQGKYQIVIEQVAKGDGAKQVESDLKKVAAQATVTGEKLRDAAGRFLPKNATPEMIAAAQAAKDAGKAAETGAEGFKLFGRHAHEAHAALHVLNDAIPGFAQMARFLSNRLTALMGVGAVAITFLKGKIEAMKEALDSLQSSPGARGEWAEKLAEKAEESAVAFNVWEDHIQRVIKAEQTLDQITERSLAVAREHIGTQKAIGDAQKELDEARLALRLKLGEVTPEQAIKIRLEIDDAAFKRDLEVKAAEIQAEIAARTKERTENRNLALDTDEQVQATKAAADTAAAAKTKNDEKLAQDKKNLEASIEAQKKAQEVVDSLEGKGAWGGNYDISDPQYYALKAAKEQVEAEAAHQGKLRKSIGQETGKKEGLDTAAEITKHAYEEAKSKYEGAVKRDKELENKIASLTEDLAAEQAKTAALESLHGQTSTTNAHTQEVDEINRRIQEEEKHGFPNSPQGESDYGIDQARAVASRAQAGLAGPNEVHATLAMLTRILGEHVNRTQADRQLLDETRTTLSNIEGQLVARGPRS